MFPLLSINDGVRDLEEGRGKRTSLAGVPEWRWSGVLASGSYPTQPLQTSRTERQCDLWWRVASSRHVARVSARTSDLLTF